MSASKLKRIKELEAEHSKLKRMDADLAMENDALRELIEKSSKAGGEARGRGVAEGGSQAHRHPSLRSRRP